MKKIVTMGEIMLRLSTPNYQRFIQSDSFDISYGGGEANVAISLSNYGLNSYFVSKLPKNPIGENAINHLRRFNVNTDYIARGGDRTGIYFIETGASMRPSRVVYDRTNSALAEADLSDFDFDNIFNNAEWFHFSGITPALSEKAAKLAEEALKTAKKYNVPISVDLNYRKKLWTPEKANEVMTTLMQYADVVLGFRPGNKYIKTENLKLEEYKDIFKQMHEKFELKYLVTTLRESYSASDNRLSALIYDGNELYHSKKYDIRIVDRVGGGDSFAGGLIYSLVTGKSFKEALDFAVAASALKHTIFGDYNLVSDAEVNALVNGDTSGRVHR